jgi:uncharacterized membrane protein
MEFIPEWAPNIHPLIVHFPIGILLLAFGLNLASLFFSDKWWDEQKSTLLYVIGGLSAFVAFRTGKEAADSIFLVTEAQSVLSTHADWATWTVWFFIIYAVARIALHWFKLLDRKAFQVLALLAVAPGVFLLFETAEHGGELVYGYGAGTGQLIEEEVFEPVISDSSSSIISTSFNSEENGDWSWEMSQNSVTELLENFHWVNGSITQLTPLSIEFDDNYVLQLSASESANSFVTHYTYQNIQMDLVLNIGELEGEIEIIHHLKDENNYDYVRLNSNGMVTQGRISDGSDEIFEQSEASVSGWLSLRVVADGTHFRGYINQEMIVHGHGDAPETGFVGLNISGKGTMVLDRIELTQL